MRLLKKQLLSQKQLKHVDQLSEEDFLELSHILAVKTFKRDTDIYRFDDVPTSFYIIIYGRIQRIGPNPSIPDWNWAKDMLEALKEWKRIEIDDPA